MRIQDKLIRLRNKRGFTLVELMIVVAIIGVLAALAIYGVRKYLTNAKSAEARMALGRIAKDGQAAYDRESIQGTVVSIGASAAIAHGLCPTSASVPSNKSFIQNKKYQSSPGDWSKTGWSCLRFTMNDPQYFMYTYTADAAGIAGTAGGGFTAMANGDLDGDGNLSSFQFFGQIQALSGENVLTMAPTIQETAAEE